MPDEMNSKTVNGQQIVVPCCSDFSEGSCQAHPFNISSISTLILIVKQTYPSMRVATSRLDAGGEYRRGVN